MRYNKDHRQETHDRIVQKAAERFRAEGIDAVGVASLMSSLGLTAGGFYAHFDSKQALVTEVCNDGFGRTTGAYQTLLQSKPKGQHLATVIDTYLSPRHRDAPEHGCFAAANAGELARHPLETRASFTHQLTAWIAVIEAALQADGLSGDARGIASALVGAMTLARAVDDPVLSDAFLASGRRTVKDSVTTSKKKPVTGSAPSSTALPPER